MLDQSLPTFVLKPSTEKPKQDSAFLYSQHGADFEPLYTLRHLDPEQHASRNRYAVAIYDAYNPDILFAEVLLIPEWTQPTLSAEQIRLNGGVPPPPEPILPTEFTIQLYNPDQQIQVRHRPATLTGAASWEFEMPQQSFRAPSLSTLDRSQHDPAISIFTPKLSLKWKRHGKLSKDLACFLSGKSDDPDSGRKRNKEPDVVLAIFKGLKEVTMYESNMARLDIEDLKGFEVALLLGAIVIRDVFFVSMKETFNLGPGGRKATTTSPRASPSTIASAVDVASHQQLPLRPATQANKQSRIPPTDPRSQWELDVETARLQKQTAAEEKARKKKDAEEQRKIKIMLEEEEREARRQQLKIDKETERLRQLYGQEDSSARPTISNLSSNSYQSSTNVRPGAYESSQSAGSTVPNSWGGYSDGGPSSNQPGLLQPLDKHKLKEKSSIFGFRRTSEQDPSRLQKKQSSLW